MFERKTYKKDALAQLKGKWKTPVLVTLLSTVIFAAVEAIQNADFTGSTLIVSAIVYFITGATVQALSYFFLFLRNSHEPVKFGTFLEGLASCLTGFLALLWMTLWTTLWSMLFIIPGIIKSIAYSQMFFILAEHPKTGVMKAMKLSMAMTKGHKMDLFVMSLSFLGWHLLGLLTAGILEFWIIPYQMTASANAYYYLKQHAFATGELTPSDFE